jgi:uncharacterized linocin/CFP29 family protein
MDHLKRELAPVAREAWQEIEDEARRILRLELAGRRLVDVDGPVGWDASGLNLGVIEQLDDRGPGRVGVRRVQPFIEVEVRFLLPIEELDSVYRGKRNLDLAPVAHAAQEFARLENRVIFGGLAEGDVRALGGESPHESVRFPSKITDVPAAVLVAARFLEKAGIGGPYVLALGQIPYERVLAATDEGYPVANHLTKTVVKQIVRAPAIDGALLLSARGGDFKLILGQDASVGYVRQTEDAVELFLSESFAFRVIEPSAAIRMVMN